MKLSSRNIVFIIFSIIMLGLSHLYSRSMNPVQISAHVFSLLFIYIVAFKEAPNKTMCCNKKPKNHSDDATQKKPIVTECLQNQCTKAASLQECGKYVRCQWIDGNCTTKHNLCENLNITTCNDSSKDCSWDDANNRCSWNKQHMNYGINEYSNLYDAETYGLNKPCFKVTDAPNLNDVSLKDFVDSLGFRSCAAKCSKTDQKCIDKCKLDSLRKLKCETSEGYKYDVKRKTCNRFYSMSESEKNVKMKAHNHLGAKIHIGGKCAPVGYKRTQLFKMSQDRQLFNLFKVFVFVIVILLNINVIKLLNNYKKN